MATYCMQFNLLTTRLRDTLACNGHAMPIGLAKACIGGEMALVFTAAAHGLSVPISWESPPTLQE